MSWRSLCKKEEAGVFLLSAVVSKATVTVGGVMVERGVVAAPVTLLKG